MIISRLSDLYPPSVPCDCDKCRAFCNRPGWWTVEQAERVIESGLYDRMMLEVSPDMSFLVLSPAFKGCEMKYAVKEIALFGCCFLKEGKCELHGTELQPLECRFCHHDRIGQGAKCHNDIGDVWNTFKGQALILKWVMIVKKLQNHQK